MQTCINTDKPALCVLEIMTERSKTACCEECKQCRVYKEHKEGFYK